MIESKKELKEQYSKGEIKDNAVYNPSMFDAVVLVEWDDETVFGYYQYEDHEKEFFKVKHNMLEDDTSFTVKGRTFRGSNFLRV